jgi:predicted nucleic-acid-binding protein
MAHLVDTSLLARLANTADTLHPVAARAILELHQRGEVLHITAQNLVEFRNLATRPVPSKKTKPSACRGNDAPALPWGNVGAAAR